MNQTKATIGCLANFFLGALGVVGIGWLMLLKFPKAATAVYIIGGILILMCLWSAYDEMKKKLKPKKDLHAPIDVKAIDVGLQKDETDKND